MPNSRRITITGWLRAGLATILLALLPRTVAAHANLVASDPPANAVLERAPATARLRFTEPLDAAYSRVLLRDTATARTIARDSRIDPADPYALLLDLPELADGRYALEWRTLSTVDGHTAQGIVPFAVGDAAAAPLLLPPPPPDPLLLPSPLDVALRWLLYGALGIAVGTLIFGALVAQPVRIVAGALDHRLRRLAWLAAVLATIASAAQLWLAASTAERDPLSFAAGSRVGWLLALRLGCTLALAIGLARPRRSLRWLALLLGGAALATISLLSHSAASVAAGELGALLTLAAIGFDLLHLLGTAAWIGALPALLLSLATIRQASPDERAGVAVIVVARFTALATAAVIVLAATGTYAALRAFGSVAELWTTTYGLALLVKLIFFGGLLLFGAYNRWRVAPLLALPAHTPVQVQRLRACVGAEIGLSAIVLLAVGVLTASSPPRTLVTPGVDHHATARVNGVTLDLQIVHGAVGDVYALALRGLPPDAQPSVVLRSSMIGHDMGTLELPLEPVEPGRWGARGSLFVMPGHTAIEAVVLQPGVINDLRYTWTVTPHQPLERDVSPVVLGWGALVVAAVCAIALSQVPGAGWRGALAMRHNPASIGPNRSQKAD